MPVVDVSCPNCHVKLKAPESMAGKKAKCKKCGTGFRIPGSAPASDSASEGQALSVMNMPLPPADDDATEVMMAEPVDAGPPPAPRAPQPATRADLADLPSADPFDFSPAAKAAKPAPAAAPAAPAPAPPESSFGAAKAPSAPKLPPVAPPAQKTVAPPPAPPPAAKKAAEPKPDDDPPPPPKAKSAPKLPEPESEPEPTPEPEPETAPAAVNPFSFSALADDPPEPLRSKRRKDDDEDEDDRPRKKRRDDDEDEPRARKKRRDEEDEDDRPRKKRRDEDDGDGEKPRYRRQEGGMVKSIAVTGAIGLLALALGITAIIVYVKNNKKEPEEVKKDEKKDDTLTVPGGIPPDPVNPKDKEPKEKEKEPKEKEKDPEPPPGGRPFVKLPALKSFTVGPAPGKGALSDKAKNQPPALDVPAASVRRVFPPLDPTAGDTYVLTQVAPAAGGKNERFALDTFGPAGNRIPAARIEYEGDGSVVPIADLRTTAGGVSFLASVSGKLHVWTLGEMTRKTLDGVSPYAEKPEHAKAGVAAAFFAPDPNQVVVVSTAGQVLLYDIGTKKPISEFIPPNGVPGRVALGKSIAKADGSVAVAVAGILYQIRAAPGLEVISTHDLGGDVGRSLALAVSGTPGRLLYVFETARKEIAVLGLPLGAKPNRVLYKWPTESIGEPKGALWTNGDVGGVIVDRGVVWFDDHGEKGHFIPLVVTQPPGDGQFFGDDQHFWYVVPDAAMPTKKSAVVAITGDFGARADYLKSFPNQPLRAVRIDEKGLSK